MRSTIYDMCAVYRVVTTTAVTTVDCTTYVAMSSGSGDCGDSCCNNMLMYLVGKSIASVAGNGQWATSDQTESEWTYFKHGNVDRSLLIVLVLRMVCKHGICHLSSSSSSSILIICIVVLAAASVCTTPKLVLIRERLGDFSCASITS